MSFQLIRKSCGTITTLTHFGNLEEKRLSKFRQPRFKNAKLMTFQECKSFIFETLCFLSNLMALVLTLVLYEWPLMVSDIELKLLAEDVLTLSAASAFLLSGLACFCEVKTNKLADGRFLEDDTTASQITLYTLKSALMLLHPSSYLQKSNNLNDYLAIASYLRILPIYFYLAKISRFYGTRAGRLLSVYGHRAKSTSIKFAVKCIFKQQGLLAHAFLMFFATVVLSLVGRIFCSQNDIFTEIYFLVITMSTVGYGEHNSEPVQKIIVCIVIILGSFASSVSTLYFLDFFELQQKQLKAYRLIKRLKVREEIACLKQNSITEFLNSKNSIPQKHAWRQLERSLDSGKSRIFELVISQSYHTFCNNVKLLVEKQLLSDHLMSFYFQRRRKFDQEKQRQHGPMASSRSGRLRAQDKKVYHDLRKQILCLR